MQPYGLLPGRYPAIVSSYDAQTRTCRVDIPGLTDGGDVLPDAEIEYPIGDKSRHGDYPTEIEILPGDTVWIAFIGGDARYPIITGWRNPQAGNDVEWRRWHHANIELLADDQMRAIAGGDTYVESATKVTVKAPVVIIDAPETTCTGNVTIEGNLSVTGNSVTHRGTNIGDTHIHTGVTPGPGVTGKPA